MASKRKRARRMRSWRVYQRRIDALVEGQRRTAGLLHPMRANPGFFRAEGWSRWALRQGDLRHGS